MSDWEVVKDDSDTIVLKRRPDGDGCSGDGCGCMFVIIIIILLHDFFFGEPSGADLGKEKYLEKAESFVEDYVIDWQEKNWQGWGWQPKTFLGSDEPEYNVEVADWKRNEYQKVSRRVKYLGKGYYAVTVITDTHLKSKKGNRARVRETFVFNIKREPKDKYQVLEVKKIDMDPPQENFEEMLRKWTKS